MLCILLSWAIGSAMYEGVYCPYCHEAVLNMFSDASSHTVDCQCADGSAQY